MSASEIIQLVDYCLTHIRMDYRAPSDLEGIDFNKREVTLHFDAEAYSNVESEDQHRLMLRVAGGEKVADKEDVGIHFTAEINGIFVLPKGLSKEKQKEMLYFSGVGILYSTLRGLIGGFSGSFPGGRVCLPTVAPRELLKAAIGSKHNQPSDATPDSR